jgi:hypothetical protein
VAATLAQFRNTFSEFRSTEDAEIEAKLVLARLEVNTTVWGPRADAGVLYMAAHKIALAPAGQNAKLKPENAAKTVYLMEFNRMKRAVTLGVARTAGAPPADAFDLPGARNGC